MADVVQETSSPKYFQDDEVNEECKELLPSLPKERGVVFPNVYNYQGFWYHAKQLQGLIAFQKHFEAQDDDILLVTTPKSGTTWLKAIVFTLINRGRYDVSDSQHPLLSKNPHDLVPPIDLRIYFQCSTPDLSCFTCPRQFATHLPFVSLPNSVQSSTCKLVYLCRNPKDTFVSLWHFTKELRRLRNADADSFEDEFDMFCRGVSAYGPIWDHALGYWQKSLEMPCKVLFLKYEDLKQQPIIHLKKLAQFLDCPFSAEEERSALPEEILKFCSFENLSNLEVNKSGKLSTGFENKAFFRRGGVGDWKNILTAEMAERMDCLVKQKFHAFGLEL